MTRIFKTLTAVVVGSLFIVGSVLCCCVRHLAVDVKVKSCCAAKHAKSESSKKSCDGCSSVVKSVETVKVFELSAVKFFMPFQKMGTGTNFYAWKTLKNWSQSPFFRHSPPALVPLYIQFHSLRI